MCFGKELKFKWDLFAQMAAGWVKLRKTHLCLQKVFKTDNFFQSIVDRELNKPG